VVCGGRGKVTKRGITFQWLFVRDAGNVYSGAYLSVEMRIAQKAIFR